MGGKDDGVKVFSAAKDGKDGGVEVRSAAWRRAEFSSARGGGRGRGGDVFLGACRRRRRRGARSSTNSGYQYARASAAAPGKKRIVTTATQIVAMAATCARVRCSP